MSSRQFDEVLIDNLAAQHSAGYIDIVRLANQIEFGFHTEFSAGTTAGQVLIETASSRDYAGTWAVLATINWAAASKSHYTAITGAARVIRARISTAIADGTVYVRAVGNK